jgi:Zn-dependent oligopeptidase
MTNRQISHTKANEPVSGCEHNAGAVHQRDVLIESNVLRRLKRIQNREKTNLSRNENETTNEKRSRTFVKPGVELTPTARSRFKLSIYCVFDDTHQYQYTIQQSIFALEPVD